MTNDPYNLRDKSDNDLYEWLSGWKPSTSKYIAGQQELHRRNQAPTSRRAWIAIGISLAALIVSVVALIGS